FRLLVQPDYHASRIKEKDKYQEECAFRLSQAYLLSKIFRTLFEVQPTPTISGLTTMCILKFAEKKCWECKNVIWSEVEEEKCWVMVLEKRRKPRKRVGGEASSEDAQKG